MFATVDKSGELMKRTERNRKNVSHCPMSACTCSKFMLKLLDRLLQGLGDWLQMTRGYKNDRSVRYLSSPT